MSAEYFETPGFSFVTNPADMFGTRRPTGTVIRKSSVRGKKSVERMLYWPTHVSVVVSPFSNVVVYCVVFKLYFTLK